MENSSTSPFSSSHIRELCEALNKHERKLLCDKGYTSFRSWKTQQIPTGLINDYHTCLDKLRHIKNNGYDDQKYKDIIKFWTFTIPVPHIPIGDMDISVLRPSDPRITFLQDVRNEVFDLIEML